VRSKRNACHTDRTDGQPASNQCDQDQQAGL
jgi:hypothetical protein